MKKWVKVMTAHLRNKKLREKYGIQDAYYFRRKEGDQETTPHRNVLYANCLKNQQKQKQCCDGGEDQWRKGQLRPQKGKRKSSAGT